MADLTKLESKLGEVLGMAMAAEGAASPIQKRHLMNVLDLAGRENPDEVEG